MTFKIFSMLINRLDKGIKELPEWPFCSASGKKSQHAGIASSQYPYRPDLFPWKFFSGIEFPQSIALLIIKRLEFMDPEHLKHRSGGMINPFEQVCRRGKKQ